MRAIARNILRKKPDLVGLNEADAVLTQSPADNGPLLGGTSATTVRYDFIQLILDRLNKGSGAIDWSQSTTSSSSRSRPTSMASAWL